MNRKQLTANQIIAGARAYSHNASRRAHQLSGPKRVQAFARPVHGETYGSDSDLIRTFVHDEVCEECGYHVCSKAGLCGPQVTPKPSARALDNLGAAPGYRGFTDGPVALPAPSAEPSPAGGRDPLIGTRWLVNGDGCHLRRGSVITVCNVITVDHAHNCAKVMCTSGLEWFVPARGDKRIGLALERELEPAPSPVSEAPAVESDPIAECERLGLWFTEGKSSGAWNVRTETVVYVRHAAGITDKTEAARAALEAWSRREPAQ